MLRQNNGAWERKEGVVCRSGYRTLFQLLIYVAGGFLLLRKGEKMTIEGFEDGPQLLRQLISVARCFIVVFSGDKSCRRFFR